MRTVCLLLAGIVTGVSALVSAYHIDPKTAAMSGKVSGNPEFGGVSEILTINFDELDSTSGAYCELFAGTKGAGGQYQVAVLSYPGGFPIGSGVADGNVDHQWTKFKIGVEVPESIVKGKQLEFRFTRSGSDSIQYYYQDGDPYKYGWMQTNGSHAGQDLCARVYGEMRPCPAV